MEIQVREARKEDFMDIVEIHCSDVEKWYRYIGNKKVEAHYEELTPFEKWLHGGPWMDPETIKLHFEILKESGGKAFVAVIEDKVVGEAEIVFSKEPEPYGKYCYLEVLVVHKNYRRCGIGTKLVRYCLEYAKKLGYKLFDVIPEDERAKRLYLKLGFRKMFDLCKMKKRCEIGEENLTFREVSPRKHPGEMLLISGHWYPSTYIWQNILRIQDYNKFEGFNLRKPWFFEIYNSEKFGLLAFQTHFTKPSLCIVYIWVKPWIIDHLLEQIAENITYRAWELGFYEVFVEIDENNISSFKAAGYEETERVEYLRKYLI